MAEGLLMDMIIVGIDRSPHSESAIAWAVEEATRRDMALRLVHTIPLLYDISVSPESGAVPEEVIDARRRVLEDAVAFAYGCDPDVGVDRELLLGPASKILLEQARDAAMIVLGGHEAGTLSRWLPGSTAWQVIAHARVPAVVVDDLESVPSGEVVLGVDGAPGEQTAIRFAFEEAVTRGARLHAIHAWAYPGVFGPAIVQPRSAGLEHIVQAETRVLSEALAPWQERFPGVEVVAETVQGRPARILTGASTRADLLVVGTRGRGGFAGLRLGSVTHALLHHTQCPLAAVPPGEPNQE